ncbi:MAG: hypothetical protein U0263_39115 [Polyangiaceae bacterium]
MSRRAARRWSSSRQGSQRDGYDFVEELSVAAVFDEASEASGSISPRSAFRRIRGST